MNFLDKFTKRRTSPEDERRRAFAREYIVLIERLADIRANFDAVCESSAIDALIFEENAVLCRLEQLYREARAEGISVEIYDRRK